jgi:hypothetical protein
MEPGEMLDRVSIAVVVARGIWLIADSPELRKIVIGKA